MQTATPPRPAESSAPVRANGSAPARANGQSSAPARKPLFVLSPEDGIATVLLAASVVYITIVSIQSVTPAWAPGMQILSPLALIGLVAGYVAVQQRLLPNWLVHFLAFCLGCLVAFWMTADAVLGGGKRLLLSHLGTWLDQTYHQQPSNDNSIFLLFLAVLTYLLAYLTFWLVLHSRRPWLAVLANGVVLLINLNWAPPQELIFLVIFLLAALLLLVRFTLAENVRLWRTRRLRYSPDLGWDFLQAGAIFAVIVLLLAYNLPVGAANAQISAFVNDPNGALQGIQQYWNSLFPGLNGPGTGGLGFFSASLELTGDVNLPNTEIFRYVSTEPTEYLLTQTYDTYDGHNSWSQSLSQSHPYPANISYPSPSPVTRLSTQTITLTNVGAGTHDLFASGSPDTFSVPSSLSVTADGGIPIGWLAQRTLTNGQSYSAQSYLSNATVDDLRAIQYPSTSASDAYPASTLHLYLNNAGTTISPEVAQLAAQWTQGATNPYDAAMDIEAHLHSAPFQYSLHNGTIPSNQDAIVWFLNNHKGFCTFFASTMALMMRSLGMPARIASGVSSGEYDSTKGDYVERGTNLHVWTQIYFPGYGWINFEPTQSFQDFTRTVPGATPGAGSPTPRASGTAASRTPTVPRRDQGQTGVGAPPTPAQTALRDLGLSVGFLLALLALVAAAVIVWWRALYRNLPLVAGAFARVTRLGAWSGHPPRRDQTPYEYTDELSAAVPQDTEPLHELSDLYVRERWGGTPAPQSETLTAYEQARGALLKAIARRWHEIPAWLFARLGARGHLRRSIRERIGEWIDRLIEPRSV